MDFFYHNSIKTYTIALLDMFSHIQVPRYNSEGEKIEDFSVPITFGNRDKAYMLSEHDLENIHNGNVNMFPRMVLSFSAMNKAQDRNTNKMHKINKKKQDEDIEKMLYEYHYNGAAYDFEYIIYIATKTFTDATIIIEQIAPMFRPDITIKIQELDIQEEPTSVPVMLGDFGIELPEDMAEDEIRIIEVDFPITLKGTLYLPIIEEEVIKKLNINTHIIDRNRDMSAIKYGIDESGENQSLASTISNFPHNEEIPETVGDIPTVQSRSDTNIQHFENSKEDI